MEDTLVLEERLHRESALATIKVLLPAYLAYPNPTCKADRLSNFPRGIATSRMATVLAKDFIRKLLVLSSLPIYNEASANTGCEHISDQRQYRPE